MAPPPEYDKEPKAPDKSATNVSGEESKSLHNLVNDQQTNSDNKLASTACNVELENNKNVEHLDDGQLKALLDEAITYKCPKDREGKSILFNELLEEVEQDEQALEAAARELSGGRATRRPRVGRRALPHSNSLQNLEQEALAPGLRRVRHAPHPHSNVSARAIHGGSLPSDVDKSSLGEEPSTRGTNYLATVQCVNPLPLAQRRVSASDANCPAEMELINRRSKPPFPMTYTARATLEIGSSSVCSGRAVTTTTASNQVRKHPQTPPHRDRYHQKWNLSPNLRNVSPNDDTFFRNPLTNSPPERLCTRVKNLYSPRDNNVFDKSKQFNLLNDKRSDSKQKTYLPKTQKRGSIEKEHNMIASTWLSSKKCLIRKKLPPVEEEKVDLNQLKLISALVPKTNCDIVHNNGGGSTNKDVGDACRLKDAYVGRKKIPRGPQNKNEGVTSNLKKIPIKTSTIETESTEHSASTNSQLWLEKVNTWYEGLQSYSNIKTICENPYQVLKADKIHSLAYKNIPVTSSIPNYIKTDISVISDPDVCDQNISSVSCNFELSESHRIHFFKNAGHVQGNSKQALPIKKEEIGTKYFDSTDETVNTSVELNLSRKKYRERVGTHIIPPDLSSVNPKNVRSMTIGKPLPKIVDIDETNRSNDKNIDQKQRILADYKIISTNRIEPCSPNTIFLHTIDTSDTKINSYSKDISTCMQDKRPLMKIEKSIELTQISGHYIEVESKRSSAHPIDIIEFVDISKKDRLEKIENFMTPINDTCIDVDNKIDMTDQSTRRSQDETEKIISNIYDTCIDVDNKMELIDISTRKSQDDIEKVISQIKGSCVDVNNKIELIDISTRRSQNEIEKVISQIKDSCVEVDNKIELVGTTCIPQEETEKIISKLKETCIDVDNKIKIMDIFIRRSQDETEKVIISQIKDIDVDSKIELIDISTSSSRDDDYQMNGMLSRDKHESLEVNNIELVEICSDNKQINSSFSQYFAVQKKLLSVLEANNIDQVEHSTTNFEAENNSENLCNLSQEIANSIKTEEASTISRSDAIEQDADHPIGGKSPLINEIVVSLNTKAEDRIIDEQCVVAELPNNAYTILTFPKRLHMPLFNNNDNSNLCEDNNDKPYEPGKNSAKKSKKRKGKAVESTYTKTDTIDRNTLHALLFQNLFESDITDKAVSKAGVSTITGNKEVDSAIPFNCITTSEVVDTCNTTSSASQPAVTEDLKPLQLGSFYGAVVSLTGDPPPTARPASLPHEPRSVMTSNFNGLPLARTSYGSTASTTLDEYKKSLDENGNSLQGFSSPLSGSSQHKKPRRKKSSKNETVINPQASDGYQGNKDLNEVLRFIESNADHGRAHKLGRAKHKDDDDKSKKRSTERRKDKETKIKRATSMEELSRTKLEDLTDKPKKEWGDGAAPAKAERRSWGDDARDSFFYCDEAEVGDFRLPSDQEASAPADADFQTVTKKRKPRRRADEAEAEPSPPRAPRAPSPRARRVSAPPSERSNDSNDDLDSVHSLPADQCSQLHCNTAEAVPPRPAASPPAPPPPPPLPPPPALPASYADIARTRHNIPDLIESCNFYLEGEEAAACPGDADGYPALQCRRRDKPPLPPPPPRPRDRKERTEVPQTECPAPDVVADRRPPVILLDSTTHPRDMDGITFGFDINEQLLGGPSRRPRCDLVRDALEGGGGEGAGEGEGEAEGEAGEGGARREGEGRGEGRGVAVRAGCVALRYVPPEPPPDTHHLHQIIDYIGSAWEDVVRCGGGKLRYFSE